MFELMYSEYGTAVTVGGKVIGWVNRTVDDKLIITVGGSKKVVSDGIEAAVFLIELGLGGV